MNVKIVYYPTFFQTLFEFGYIHFEAGPNDESFHNVRLTLGLHVQVDVWEGGWQFVVRDKDKEKALQIAAAFLRPGLVREYRDMEGIHSHDVTYITEDPR